MNPHALRLYLWVIALTAFGDAKAQSVPPLMNYQGNLTNATGQPLPTGQYTLTFNVYNVPTGGSAVWGPQAITADVIDGYFNVVLSTDSTGGDSITTAFTAQPRYVSIRVDSGAEILPRQQVLSAPYAIQAGSAERTVGPANVFPGSGNVGIGTITPDQALKVVGNTEINGNIVIGGLTTTAALRPTDINASGDIEASNARLRGNLSTSGNITYSGQKYCWLIRTNNWGDLFIVPQTWRSEDCRDARAKFGTDVYYLACVFSDGDVSVGANPGAVPPRNCGWQ